MRTVRGRRVRKFGWTTLAWAVCASLLTSFAGTSAASADTNVVPDTNFRKCLNDELYGTAGTWAISAEDLSSFEGTSIYVGDDEYLGVDCWGYGSISSIEGAQYLTRITGASFDTSRISDFSPLAGASSLQLLSVRDDPKLNLSTVAQATQLRVLSLNANGITNISALARMTRLTHLELESNAIKDLSPLRGLVNLTELDLSGNSITDLTPLSGLTNLTDLQLGNWSQCPGDEGECYSSSGKHLWTWAGHNAFSDLSPLASLNRLTRLELTHTSISNISALAGLTNLRDLELSSNQIGDVSPLANLVNLTTLLLNGNRITSVSGLSRLNALTLLNLAVNRLTNLSALPALSDWGDAGCDHSDQDADWGCSPGAIEQTARILIAAPGTYAYPVAGRSGLTQAVRIKSASRSATVDSSAGTITYTKTGSAVLTFTDDTEDTGERFSGTVTAYVLPTVLTISGTAKFGRTLTIPGVPADLGGACQWLRNGSAIAGATTCSYTVAAADIGTSVTARVTVANGTSTAYKVTAPVVPAAADFSKVGKPSLSGSVRVGATVTAKPGTWSPEPDSFGYTWYRGDVAIPGATSNTYSPVAADLATKLSVSVTATKTGFTTRSSSRSAAVTVRAGVLTPAKVTFSGTPEFGTTLTASPGAWSPSGVGFSYQWFRGRTQIAGVVGSTYTPVAADVGYRLTVRVTGMKQGYTSATRSATTVATKARTLTVPARPAISGDPRAGAVLTVATGGWGPAPVKVTCQWYRGGKAIKGAADCSYTVSASDAKPVTVRVTGAKEGYKAVTLISPSTVRLDAVIAGEVTVSGSAKVGSTLSASELGWGPTPVTFGYQWLRNGAAIVGAHGSTYTLVAADRGKRVSVALTGAKAGYTSVVVTSAKTAKVAA